MSTQYVARAECPNCEAPRRFSTIDDSPPALAMLFGFTVMSCFLAAPLTIPMALFVLIFGEHKHLKCEVCGHKKVFSGKEYN